LIGDGCEPLDHFVDDAVVVLADGMAGHERVEHDAIDAKFFDLGDHLVEDRLDDHRAVGRLFGDADRAFSAAVDIQAIAEVIVGDAVVQADACYAALELVVRVLAVPVPDLEGRLGLVPQNALAAGHGDGVAKDERRLAEASRRDRGGHEFAHIVAAVKELTPRN
jgi:hypothetical protein